MTAKFFEKIDSLPIVRMLQCAAILILIGALSGTANMWFKIFIEPYGSNQNAFWNALLLTFGQITNAIFEPLVLLGFAEIIKLKKRYLSTKVGVKNEL